LTIRICVSILPKTIPEALRLIKKAEESHANFIEVRIDRLETSGKLADLTQGKTPLIATNKSSITQTEQEATLLKAAKSGFEYVDVDISAGKQKSLANELKASGAKCIMSFHDHDGSLTLPELNSTLEKELSSGADICKIVTTPKRVEDNLTLLQFVSAASAKAKVVCFGMGELGKTSRLLSPVFGGFFTFASLEQGSETAPGQMTIAEMRTVYSHLGLK
jgi:3-dehydroquinate dehydratase type I